MRVRAPIAVVVSALSIGALWSSAAVADKTPTKQEAGGASDPADPSKRVCRVETPTGSRFAVRVCKTAAEWAHDEQKAQKGMDDEQRLQRSQSCTIECQ